MNTYILFVLMDIFVVTKLPPYTMNYGRYNYFGVEHKVVYRWYRDCNLIQLSSQERQWLIIIAIIKYFQRNSDHQYISSSQPRYIIVTCKSIFFLINLFEIIYVSLQLLIIWDIYSPNFDCDVDSDNFFVIINDNIIPVIIC